MGLLKPKKILLICALGLTLTGCGTRFFNRADHKLYLALSENNVQGVKESLKDKINLEKMSQSVTSDFKQMDHRALAIALYEPEDPDAEVVQLLIDAGADVNSVYEKGDMNPGYTYLMSMVNKEELANLFLTAGADVQKEDKDGNTALEHLMLYSKPAEKEKTYRIEKMLEQAGAEVSEKTLKACLNNTWGGAYIYTKGVLEELEHQKKKIKISKILQAAIYGDNELFREEIQKSKIKKSEQKAVLAQAAANCDRQSLELLKKQGYKLDGTDQGDVALYHIACRYNTRDVAEYFLESGVSPQLKSGTFPTNAVTYAVLGGKEDTVNMLLKEGVSWQKGSGTNTWCAACSEGNESSIDVMLRCGYEPTDEEMIEGYVDCNEATFAALRKNKLPLDMKVDGDAPIDKTSAYSEAFTAQLYHEGAEVTNQALENVIGKGYTKLALEMMKDHGNLDDYYMETPLVAAIERGNLILVKSLVEQGADINYQMTDEFENQFSAMHFAAENPSTEILKYLIDKGGDVQQEDGEGKTPYDWAKEVGLSDNAQLLKQ